MPVAGILSCRHFFHAECLDQITPKLHKSDPPCPICSRFEEGDSPDHKIFARLRNSFPKFRRQLLEEGALQVPPRNTMLMLNRRRLSSVKGNSVKAFPGKLRNGGLYSSQLLGSHSADVGAVGCSKAPTGSL
ncbi:unnamed protein product [Linum tenue]|uniref:RING-type domain-containing protein n=1 Tax=Linum tenue TaxID=586396 RepID=A0AAV0JAW4_9ROSI|nr:unnamed protein product [Linum tenue]